MKKLKLDIQRFASTNKTTHYELSQYTGSDKPTYLVDYNQDMSKIDTGIYEADAKAVVNATNIGDLSELTTTDKLSLVNAINEVNSESSVVGDLQDLTTTDKSSVVGAVNEVNGKANKIGDLTNLTTTDKTSIVNAVNEVNAKGNTIGSLTNLTTTDKSSVVDAINEVNGKTDTNATNLSTTNTKVANITGTILWTNPTPNVDFGQQQITLSSDDYDELEFYFNVSKTGNKIYTCKTLKGYGGDVNTITELNENVSQYTGFRQRHINYIDDTHYQIANCLTRKNTSGQTTPDVENNDFIPLYVIGYKTGIFS